MDHPLPHHYELLRMWDLFQSDGTTPEHIESLYNLVNGSAISLEIALRNRADSPSGPVDLETSKEFKWNKTVEIGISLNEKFPLPDGRTWFMLATNSNILKVIESKDNVKVVLFVVI